ncbi:CAP domain-containing protein [Clostridium cellulovorans]|uniref:SCP-like extracellular n=1 Tax=Clostridium cellulovorans (strain ATCC 35296 / DSM 3052 / OCM 3 / 743B) TaxID=573061 RepID=D9SPZ1_CLOC7|nr:CAP domain-containing protein [Clostridium cellulovorans]ADL52127.1 SCP-like extracellular [Clostridium cellulovorans 743B]
MKRIAKMLLLLLMFVPSMASAETYAEKSEDIMCNSEVKDQTYLSKTINEQVLDSNKMYLMQKSNITNISATKSIEKEVIRLSNLERSKRGLKPLSEDLKLSRIARLKSQDMSQKNYFSHTSPTYGSPFKMIKSFGINYRSAGENIAKGQRSAQQVVNSWMNSSGHRANILNPGFTHIGVGYSPNGNYWTQMFISK